MAQKLTYEELEHRIRELEARQKLSEQNQIGDLIDSIQAGVVVHARDGTAITSNTAAQTLLGLTREQILGKTLIDPAWTFLREDGSPLPVEDYPVARVLATGQPVHDLVLGIQRHNQTEPIWVLDTAIPKFDKNGHITQIITTFTEISALKKSEEQYRNLFENTMQEVHLWQLVRDGQGEIKTWRLLEANPAALKAWGKNRAEIIGKTTNEIFAYDATGQFMPLVKKIFADGKPYFWDSYFPPTDQYYHMTSVAFGEYFMSTGTDITHLKKTELALRKSEQLLSQAEEMANMGSWEWDVENDIAHWSDGLFKIFKRTPEAGAPRWAQQSGFYTEESYAQLSKAVETCIQYGTPYKVEVQAICSDGEIRTCISRGKAEKNHEGKVFRLLGVFDDITDRVKTAQALRQSERLLRNVIDTSTDYIFVKDKHLRTILCNQTFAQALNKQPADLIGKTDLENGWNAELVKGNAEKGIIGYEAYDLEALSGKTVQNTDMAIIGGETRFLHSIKIPLKDENDAILGVLGISRDITEQKQVEVEIQAARDFLNTLIDLSMFGMWIADPSGTVIQVNRILCETLNLSDEQIIGQYNVFQDKNMQAQGVMPQVRSVFEQHQPARFNLFWQETSPREIAFQAVQDMYIDVYMFPILDKKGSLKNVVCQWIDISELKNAERKLREMVEVDALTQVYSRQHLLGLAERMFARIKQDQTALLCMMFDIDHFKSINDQYGHKAGDLALAAFSEVVAKNLRSNDIFGRLGGEEFLAVIPDISLEIGQKLANRIRQEVANTPIRVGTNSITMTVSIGVAIYQKPKTVATFAELVERSDQALYAAKHSGRNRVCVDRPD